jgi:RNA polymerase sigma-70 factor (ECF subfamily)
MFDEAEYVRMASEGDVEAFGILIERHAPRVELMIDRHLGKNLRHRVEVADVLQEACLVARENIAHFAWSGPDSFLIWFCTLAENVIRQEARPLKRAVKIESVPDLDCFLTEPPSGATKERRWERGRRVLEALSSLRDDHRRVIQFVKFEKMTTREAGKLLGRSASATRQLLVRALRNFKTQFGDTDSVTLPPMA